jgi:DNA polymerase I-like protein with 3'-5' exonuclease and polymerase domains
MDAEKAGAFFVQTNAQGKLREAMIELEEEGWNERCNLINQVHDSLVYEMPIELCAEAIPAIAAIMERPAKRLKHPTICPEGLVLMCEASIGLDWGSIEEVSITNGRVEAWPESVRGLLQ